MIYYTADLHLGHANVIRHCSRPFSSVDEMDEALVQNWNSRVHRLDTVYIVGDLFFRNRRPCEEFLSEMKGRKHLIIGNHDSSWMKKTDWPGYFESVNSLLTMKDNGRLITLCHYPLMTWPDSRHDSFMVYGHIHNNTNAGFWPLIRDNPRMLNAGVDLNDFFPVTLDEMIQNNEKFKARSEGPPQSQSDVSQNLQNPLTTDGKKDAKKDTITDAKTDAPKKR